MFFISSLLLSWSCTKDPEDETSTLDNIFSCVGSSADLFHDEIIHKVFVRADEEDVTPAGPLDVAAPEFIERDDAGEPTGRKVVKVTIQFSHELMPGSLSAEDDLEIQFGDISNLADVSQGGDEFSFEFELGQKIGLGPSGIECPTSRVVILLKKEGRGSSVVVVTEKDAEGNPKKTRGLDSDYLIVYDFIRGVGINPHLLQVNYENARGGLGILGRGDSVGDPAPIIMRLDPAVDRVKPHSRFDALFSNEMRRVDHQVTPSGRADQGRLAASAPLVFEWGSDGDAGLAVNQTYASVFWSSLMGAPPEGHFGTVDKCGLKLAPNSYVAFFLTSGVRIDEIVAQNENGVEKHFGPPISSKVYPLVAATGPIMEDVGGRWTVRGARSLGGGSPLAPTPAVRKVKVRLYAFEVVPGGGPIPTVSLADFPDASGEVIISGSDGDPSEPPVYEVGVSLPAGAKPGKKLVQVEGLTAAGQSLGVDEIVADWRPPVRFLSFKAANLPADATAAPAPMSIGAGENDPSPPKDPTTGQPRPAVFVNGFRDEFDLSWDINDADSVTLCGQTLVQCEQVQRSGSKKTSYLPASIGPNPSELEYTLTATRKSSAGEIKPSKKTLKIPVAVKAAGSISLSSSLSISPTSATLNACPGESATITASWEVDFATSASVTGPAGTTAVSTQNPGPSRRWKGSTTVNLSSSLGSGSKELCLYLSGPSNPSYKDGCGSVTLTVTSRQCCSDAECTGVKKVCSSHTCVTCTTEKGCSSAQTCIGGGTENSFCQDFECCKNEDCPGAEDTCNSACTVSASCDPPVCGKDKPCAEQGKVCKNPDKRGASCDWVCCLEITCPGGNDPCVRDGCPEAEDTCVNGCTSTAYCKPPECGKDKPCTEGKHCKDPDKRGAACVECTSSIHCAEGLTCSASNTCVCPSGAPPRLQGTGVLFCEKNLSCTATGFVARAKSPNTAVVTVSGSCTGGSVSSVKADVTATGTLKSDVDLITNCSGSGTLSVTNNKFDGDVDAPCSGGRPANEVYPPAGSWSVSVTATPQ